MHSPEKSLPEGLLNKPVTAMEKLLSQTNNLTVLDEDGWEINEDGGAEVGKLCAIGRLCSNRTMNRSLIKTILGWVWGLPEKVWGVEIKHTSMNAIFLVDGKKDITDIFGKGTMGSGSNLNSGIPQCIDNRNPIPTNLRKESKQGKLKNSALLTPPAIAVAQYTHESGIADMEVIVEKGSSSIDKFVGKRTGLINEVSQTPEEKNLINHKRNGDWREELMGNSSSILATPNSLDPQLSTTIQKASSIETVQLFEVPDWLIQWLE
ncbi:hypothetical protein CsatB_003674 [Cannabis sativa]